MNPSQIKTECELIYTQIKGLEERRIRLRSICKHENIHKEHVFFWMDYCVEITCADCGKDLPPNWEKLGEIDRKEI